MSEHDNENDPIKCCILQICCGQEGAQATLADELAKHSTPQAQAAWLVSAFDLAPKGLVTPLLQRAAEMGSKRKK